MIFVEFALVLTRYNQKKNLLQYRPRLSVSGNACSLFTLLLIFRFSPFEFLMPFLEGTIVIIVLYIVESYYETMSAVFGNALVYRFFVFKIDLWSSDLIAFAFKSQFIVLLRSKLAVLTFPKLSPGIVNWFLSLLKQRYSK